MMHSLLFLVFLSLAAAEDGLNGWLRYAPLPCTNCYLNAVPSNIVALNGTETSPVFVAGLELQKGIQGILGKQVSVSHGFKTSLSVVVGTVDEYNKAGGNTRGVPKLEEIGRASCRERV